MMSRTMSGGSRGIVEDMVVAGANLPPPLRVDPGPSPVPFDARSRRAFLRFLDIKLVWPACAKKRSKKEDEERIGTG